MNLPVKEHPIRKLFSVRLWIWQNFVSIQYCTVPGRIVGNYFIDYEQYFLRERDTLQIN